MTGFLIITGLFIFGVALFVCGDNLEARDDAEKLYKSICDAIDGIFERYE